MLKIKDIFNKNRKSKNQKYNIGDTVFLLGYPTSNFKSEGKQLKIFKMKVTEIRTNEKGIIYRTNMHTDLEYENGGYTHFDDFDTIKQAINEFCDESFMDWNEKVDDTQC